RFLAAHADAPLDWLAPLKEAVTKAPEDQRNYGMFVGFMSGLAGKHPETVEHFKREALASKLFAPVLVMVTGALGITESDVRLVLSGLRDGLIPPSALMNWTM